MGWGITGMGRGGGTGGTGGRGGMGGCGGTGGWVPCGLGQAASVLLGCGGAAGCVGITRVASSSRRYSQSKSSELWLVLIVTS